MLARAPPVQRLSDRRQVIEAERRVGLQGLGECPVNPGSRPARAAENAAQNASPTVLNTYPPACSIASRRISSWRRSAAAIASRSASHSRVEPSTSVNNSVTVPDGAPLIDAPPAGVASPRPPPDPRSPSKSARWQEYPERPRARSSAEEAGQGDHRAGDGCRPGGKDAWPVAINAPFGKTGPWKDGGLRSSRRPPPQPHRGARFRHAHRLGRTEPRELAWARKSRAAGRNYAH
jgi:hypothetical protein